LLGPTFVTNFSCTLAAACCDVVVVGGSFVVVDGAVMGD